ncbi:aminoglycoside phosphotransferase family protein [Reinekea marinisedimentorum]|uniref:Phosphotransferase family enzyme n=1 Tax=Reinekea marinisedimentorum TaxID=230495 RepID=A0A4R3I8C9_9GAMM|nr:aminoglycoside phosphotransferase family protein [Reinekea marinisedimentorum]TCS42512.1 phosphotransferase family enzyme [Reinekea marinisedimentorum]
MKLTTEQQSAIYQAAKCRTIIDVTPMQSLWAGQGELVRMLLSTAERGSAAEKTKSLVVKQIIDKPSGGHPRGWNTTLSQQRKRRSYQVELHWYRQFASSLNSAARMPGLVYSEASNHGLLLVLEDLAVDYPVRFTAGQDDRPTDSQIQSCIHWLAQFHARTLQHNSEGLWPVGGYWHLDTRPDEWQAMPEGELKRLAGALDEQLRACPYQSIIHGDAKLANFCFDASGKKVAAVDFQYVGNGPGVKDLMLLLSSVMPDERLVTEAHGWVEYYFEQLSLGLKKWQKGVDADEVIAAWRPLYPVAWADFHRFLKGWSPGHWKIGRYCWQESNKCLLEQQGIERRLV